MEHPALVLTDNDLRKLLKEALREINKKIDRGGMESLVQLWQVYGKDYTIAKHGRPDATVEVLLANKKGKTWLMTLGPVVTPVKEEIKGTKMITFDEKDHQLLAVETPVPSVSP